MSWRPSGLIVCAILAAAALAPAVMSLPSGVTPQPIGRESEVLSYPVRDASGAVVGARSWRVVNATGNCCENHVMTSPDGRIMDLGGDAVFITDDDGLTWTRAAPLLQVSGEGSIAYAPNGDILAIVWDPYSGDRMTAMRLAAGSTQWESATVALHRPLYDRPWLAVVPGPISFVGQTYPYATLVVAGSGPSPEDPLVSVDGLVYVPSPRIRLGPAQQASFAQPAHAWADWVQPIGQMRVAPLPSGGLLATEGCTWQRLSASLMWSCATPPSGVSPIGQTLRFDSLGRAHLLSLGPGDLVAYRVSDDAGSTWRTTPLPVFGDLFDSDFVVNGALDQALVSLRYVADGTDHIVVLRLTDLSAATPAIEVLDVGLGDADLGAGLTSPMRMDFVSIAMLPDGRAVTSFADSKHHPPVMAIEIR